MIIFQSGEFLFCQNCGKEVIEGVSNCSHCGAVLSLDKPQKGEQEKDPIVALLLQFLLGNFGLGYFYIGQHEKGIACIAFTFFIVIGWVMGGILTAIFIGFFCLIPLTIIASAFPPFTIIDVYLQIKNLNEGKKIGQWTFFNQVEE